MDDSPEVVYPFAVRCWRPLLRLDTTGVECVVGRVYWGDVTSIALVESPATWLTHEDTAWWVVLRLRPDARPLPARGYFRGFGDKRPRLTRHGLELPRWSSEDRVLHTLRRFFDGDTTERIAYDSMGPHWPENDLGPFPKANAEDVPGPQAGGGSAT
jgi:hypothetical protein